MVGYALCPGGAWTGDFEVADLEHFEQGNSRDAARVYTTKTVWWEESSVPSFPLKTAREAAREQRLANMIFEE